MTRKTNVPKSPKIGLIGGISHESTLHYYKEIHERHLKEFNDFYFPEIVLYSLNFQKYTDFENINNQRKRLDERLNYVQNAISVLERAHCDIIALTANSVHTLYSRISANMNIPVLSIGDATLLEAKKQGLDSLLLLGIKHTMQSDFYGKTAAKYGIVVRSPQEDDQNIVNDIIFQKLCRGIQTEKEKEGLLEIIDKYKDVNGVILGCTELPLVLQNGDAHVPLLETTNLHIDAIMKYCKEYRKECEGFESYFSLSRIFPSEYKNKPFNLE